MSRPIVYKPHCQQIRDGCGGKVIGGPIRGSQGAAESQRRGLLRGIRRAAVLDGHALGSLDILAQDARVDALAASSLGHRRRLGHDCSDSFPRQTCIQLSDSRRLQEVALKSRRESRPGE